MRIRASVAFASISAAVVTSSISASVGTPSYLSATAVPSPLLVLGGAGSAPEVLDLTNLAAESVIMTDGTGGGEEAVFELDLVKGTANSDEVDQVEPEDSDPVFDADKVLTDSVTVVETRVKVFTDFIDFDPSDADVDATPVTIAESDAKDVDKPLSDTATATESISNQPDIPKTDAVTATDAVDDFDVGKNPSDTATASETIDRFDVTTEFDDTVTVTEAIENEVTLPQSDSVSAVQSNVKTFTSNVDFDLSDADVDPDPVTASDAIDDFDVDKGLTDTVTATESDAKEVTVAELADNDTVSVTEADAKDFTHGGFSDTLTAVEGIKNNPELDKTDSVTMAESNTFDVRPEYDDSVTATDDVDDFDITLAKTDSVNVTDVSVKNFTQDVDFDTSDADADADPVTVTESLGFDATHPLSDSFSPSEAHVFTFTNVYTDTATATESIATLLTLGDSEYVYPDYVNIQDGQTDFIFRPYSYTISSTEYFVPNTGVIGAAETLNSVMLADQFVTTPSDSGGLVVNFHYTDVDEDDRALGGYYFNQTPLNPGNSTVGERTIL